VVKLRDDNIDGVTVSYSVSTMQAAAILEVYSVMSEK